MKWTKIDHYTNKPIEKNTGWHICDYVCGEYKIINDDGSWTLEKNRTKINTFKTLKAAKEAAEV